MNGIWFDGIHSYDDLHLILSKVNIPPASAKTTYVDIPGSDGSVDLTEAQGEVKYKSRGCSFTFTAFPQDDFEEKKTEVSNCLNGKRCKITLDKDPDYYYEGRCIVNSFASNKKLNQIVVNATVSPYKMKNTNTVVNVNLSGQDSISTAFGNPLHLNDISPVTHTLDLKVGGMTYNDGTTLASSPATMVECVGKNTLVIPDAVQALDAYGEGISESAYNYIDWEKKQYVKCVGKVDLGTMGWSYDDTNTRFASSTLDGIVKSGARDTELLMVGYEVKSNHEDFDSTWDKVVYVYGSRIYIHDSAYTDADAFKTAMSGVSLIYELETPEVTDISSMLTAGGLTSVYPVTNLSTDGAVLDVTYFNVNHTPKEVALSNSRKLVVPTVECSDDNTVIEFDGNVVTVNAGTHKIFDLQLKEGLNHLTITGFGTVKITYQEGDL